MRPHLTRERRLAILAASLASLAAASSSLFSASLKGMSDFAHGLLVGAPLGLSLCLLIFAMIQLRKSKTACNRAR